MNLKKISVTTSSLVIVGFLALMSSGTVLAYQGDYTKKGPNCTPERHETMTNAFENNDYNSWKNLMEGRGRVTQVINEQNFDKFAEAHSLGQQGRFEEANKIRQELGLRTNNGEKVGAGYRQGNGAGRANR